MQWKLKSVISSFMWIFIWQTKGQKKDFQCFHWLTYFYFLNTFWNWCLQYTQNMLWQRHVYHWVTKTSPFLLITLCNLLGTEDINYCRFASGIFSHSWCIQDLSCSTFCSHCCLILLFMMRHTFSIGDRSGLQAGQSSTRTLIEKNLIISTNICKNSYYTCIYEIRPASLNFACGDN